MLTKPYSAEGFEKCLIDNIKAYQFLHGAASRNNKQTACIVYPPSQEELSGRNGYQDWERNYDHHHHSHPHHS
ncbi:hypothetical protein TYRP_014209 [Tyrophagus putrescentiae]|nr:hypothetical protein TYRP_014209 [Tyrophagus putrescentiae]